MKKIDDTTPDASAETQPGAPAANAPTIKVKVICNAINEGGVHYTRGEIFETTAKRADELGDSVTTNVAL